MATDLLITPEEQHQHKDDAQATNLFHQKLVRVLHVINGEHYSGAERVQDLLALQLEQFGFGVDFACVKPGKFSQMRTSQETPLFDVPMKTRIDFAAAMRLRRLIRKQKYKIVHAHTPRSLMLANMAMVGTGIPLVYHAHSPTACDSTRKAINLLNAWTERISLLGVSQLIAVSQSLTQRMSQQSSNKHRITTVPNGVPICGPLRRRKTPKNRWVLGAVALFRPRKGMEVLLDAIASLKSAGHNVHLHAVGGFETEAYEAEIHQRAKQLQIENEITWAGFSNDVNAEFAKMDLFVLPSLFGEGLPMVVLEAMANGVPVVSTKVEGVPEAIRDGIDGVLAEPADAADLAHVITKVINSEVSWLKLRKNAWKRHADHFSDVSMAQGVAEVYRKILAR